MSAHEIEEWIIHERMEADDERKAYEQAQEDAKNVEPTEPIEDV